MSRIPFYHMDPYDISWPARPMRSGGYLNPLAPTRGMARSSNNPDGGSQVVSDKDKYTMSIDVHQFAPEEITVKTAGNQVIVEGKHEEKQDDHGYVSRHFVRKFDLPADHKAEDVTCNMNPEGMLTITAPRMKVAVEGERVVPIQTSHHQPLQKST